MVFHNKHKCFLATKRVDTSPLGWVISDLNEKLNLKNISYNLDSSIRIVSKNISCSTKCFCFASTIQTMLEKIHNQCGVVYLKQNQSVNLSKMNHSDSNTINCDIFVTQHFKGNKSESEGNKK